MAEPDPASLARDERNPDTWGHGPKGGAPGGRSVLVIDDDEAVCHLFQRLLARAGYDARAVRTARAALALLQEGATFDLLLCDLVMTAMSGSEFYALVREQFPALEGRVVFMTGGSVPARESALFRERGVVALHKPFDVVIEVGRQLAQRERPVAE